MVKQWRNFSEYDMIRRRSSEAEINCCGDECQWPPSQLGPVSIATKIYIVPPSSLPLPRGIGWIIITNLKNQHNTAGVALMRSSKAFRDVFPDGDESAVGHLLPITLPYWPSTFPHQNKLLLLDTICQPRQQAVHTIKQVGYLWGCLHYQLVMDMLTIFYCKTLIF